MSAGGARRGRRDNGLDATEYAVAGDVDPRVGEHLLDVLAAGGIAAYLQPSADLNPVTRTTTVPSRPVDRLYVDRVHLATARDYLTQLADEDTGGRASADPDVEAEWEKIIAGYHLDVDLAARSWPAAEDVTVEDPADPPLTPGTGSGLANPDGTGSTGTDVRRLTSATDVSGISIGRADDSSLLDGLDTFGADVPDEDDDEGYVPPPPPPLPKVSTYAAVSVLGIIAGFALFLFPDVLPIDRNIAQVIGFAGILAGFVTLVWRLRPGNDDDDVDPDNGAVV